MSLLCQRDRGYSGCSFRHSGLLFSHPLLACDCAAAEEGIEQVMPGRALADPSEIRRERVRAVCDAAAECMLEIRNELVSMTLGNVCESQRATIF